MAKTIPEVETQKIVNEFSVNIATVNGSGSQTANLTLIRSIFKMGGLAVRQQT
jgi:2-oxoglutarate ferredoxin oxidoreductase subunit alpha